MLPNLKKIVFISGSALYNCKWLGKVQGVRSQIQTHQGKWCWLKHNLDRHSLKRGKMFLLLPSFSFCTSLSVGKLSVDTLQSDFWTTSLSSHHLPLPAHLGITWTTRDYLARTLLAPFLFPCQKCHVLGCSLTVLFLLMLPQSLVPWQPWPRIPTTPRDAPCPESWPLAGPFPTCLNRSKHGTKAKLAAGALGFLYGDIFWAGSLPRFTMLLFKRWHFNAACPAAGLSPHAQLGDLEAQHGHGQVFHVSPPALSLCWDFETELCFSLVARGSGTCTELGNALCAREENVWRIEMLWLYQEFVVLTLALIFW